MMCAVFDPVERTFDSVERRSSRSENHAPA